MLLALLGDGFNEAHFFNMKKQRTEVELYGSYLIILAIAWLCYCQAATTLASDYALAAGARVLFPSDVAAYAQSSAAEADNREETGVIFFQCVSNFPTSKYRSWLVGVAIGSEGPHLKTRIAIVHDTKRIVEWPKTKQTAINPTGFGRARFEGYYNDGCVVVLGTNIGIVCLRKEPQRGTRGIVEMFLLSTNRTEMVFAYEAAIDVDAEFAFFDINHDGTKEIVCFERNIKNAKSTKGEMRTWSWNNQMNQFTKVRSQELPSRDKWISRLRSAGAEVEFVIFGDPRLG